MLKHDYIFRRPGTSMWWIRFQCPPDFPGLNIDKDGKLHKRVERSLKTTDHREAELMAAQKVARWLSAIKRHRENVRNEKRPDSVKHEKWSYEPGDAIVELPDGTRYIADEHHVTFFTPDMTKILRREQNSRKIVSLVPSFNKNTDFDLVKRIREVEAIGYPKPYRFAEDDRIIAHWLEHNAVKPLVQREAERVLEVFRTVAPGKTFASATAEDGRALAIRLYADGLKSQTVHKMVGHLRAAFNAAFKFPSMFPTLNRNPFSGVVPQPKIVDGSYSDALKRKPFDDDMMELVARDLSNWSTHERLLWLLCATTGMRRSEAWQITGEERLQGHRVIHIGQKTWSSDRKIPLPSSLTTHLPAKISGPMFADHNPKNLGKAVLRRVRKLGINDEAIVLHSLRHRASTRLNGCQDSVRDAILGHEDRGHGGKETAAKRYFGGHPIETIAEAMKAIGYE